VAQFQNIKSGGFVPLIVSAGCCLAAGTTHAQNAQTDATSGQNEKTAPATDEAMRLGDVVVTAQKTAERSSRVPLSLTAITPEEMDALGAKGIEDLARSIPGLSYLPSSGLGTPSIAIRGIASVVGDSTTGIYIDDTPIQVRNSLFAGSANPRLFDLDRVEVLRGPQGTLFGASSEGGTIRYITPQPSLDAYSGFARAEISSTQGGDLNGTLGAAVGGPLIENELGFRASVAQSHVGGWIDRVSPDGKQQLDSNINSGNDTVARFALAWAPNERLTITPSVYYQRVSTAAPSMSWRGLGGTAYADDTAGWAIEQPSRDKFVLSSISAEYRFENFSVKSITSNFYRNYTRTDDYSNYIPELLFRVPFIPGLSGFQEASNDQVTQRNLTQELRFSSNGPSRLTWVGGLYFQRATYNFTQSVAGPMDLLLKTVAGVSVEQAFGVPLLPGDVAYYGNTRTVDKQFAAFGDVRYEIVDNLKLIFGLRAAHTELEYRQFANGPLNNPPTAASGTKDESPVTPKFGISYQLDEAKMLYANAAKGYRVGGVNNAVPSACASELAALGLTRSPTTYDSDSLWNYEVGGKFAFLDNRLSLNSSVYYTRWSNIQQLVGLPSCGFSYVGNLGSATSKGVELEAKARVSDHLILGLSASYTNSQFADDVLGGTLAGGQRALIARKGDELVGVPKWMVAANLQYNFSLADGYNSSLRADYQWLGPYVRTPSFGVTGYDPVIRDASSYYFLALRATTSWQQWETAVFLNNVFDQRPTIYAADSVLSPNSRSLLAQTSLQPRTFGISLTRYF